MKHSFVKCLLSIIMVISVLVISGCSNQFKYSYGVFLNPKDLKECANYQTLVLEGTSYLTSTIKQLKKQGHTLYSYLNIGSLETWRSFYHQYQDLIIGKYNNWDDEGWVNVADARWQDLIMKEATSLKAKDFDGLFLDNFDVYYNNSNQSIYNGLVKILKHLNKLDIKIIINGGDTFIKKYLHENNNLNLFDGVNQETVFSKIIFNNQTFGKANKVDHQYFLDYIELCSKNNIDIYLLEYTKDKALIKQIKQYCQDKNFKYYISDSIDLD